MRIAYVPAYDPGDIKPWSGLGYFILRSLEAAGCDIVPIGPLAVPL